MKKGTVNKKQTAKTTHLQHDGWHRAEVWACYLPERAPRDPVTWRIVCCDDPADDATGFTLILVPTEGKGTTSPPARIREIKSTLYSLGMTARGCARACTPQTECSARNYLRQDVRRWTGRTLPDATLADLLRRFREEINVDRRRSAFDHVALNDFADAIAASSATPPEKLKLAILADMDPKFAATPEGKKARFLACYDDHRREKFCGVKDYSKDEAWSAEDRAQVAAQRDPTAALQDRALKELKKQIKALPAKFARAIKEPHGKPGRPTVSPSERRRIVKMIDSRVLRHGMKQRDACDKVKEIKKLSQSRDTLRGWFNVYQHDKLKSCKKPVA